MDIKCVENFKTFCNKLTGFIYDNEQDFLLKFSSLKDVMDLSEVSFSGDKVRFVCVLYEGCHVADCHSLEEIIDWYMEETKYD